jgi:hypothetical protein
MSVKWTGRLTKRPLDSTITENLQFNVKDFGAVGDTTNFLNGNDDTAAIQKAVEAAGAVFTNQSAGGTVFFPAGMYRVTAPIVFNRGRQVSLLGVPQQGTAIGGCFPDYIFSNPMANSNGIDGNGVAFLAGAGLGPVSYFKMSNSYKNYLTSCSYAASGTASSLAATVAGTTLTILDHPGDCTNASIIPASGPTPATMTLNVNSTGSLLVGQLVTGPGVTAGTTITAVHSGSGLSGSTYYLSADSTITNQHITTTGIIGTFGIGQRLSMAGLQSNTSIAKVLSGSGGANSTYQLNLGATVSVETAVTAAEGGVVTFGITTSTVNGQAAIAVGDYFHVFGTYPRPYNSRYVACTGTTGTTLVGGGGIVNNGFFGGGDPGTVTMLGAVGGGCIRSDYSVHTFIEQCNLSAFNGLHAGGGDGYGALGQGAYNTFGLSVRDTGFSSGMTNGEYGTVGAFAGEADFYNCSGFSLDKCFVVSGNGF